MQWGLDKAVLRDIWSAVAGGAGHLNGTQFVQCLYLMDLAKRGVPPPAQILQGQPFPPVSTAATPATAAMPDPAAPAAGAGAASPAAVAPAPAPVATWSLQSQFGAAGTQQAAADAAMAMHVLPTLPAKLQYSEEKFQPSVSQSKVPGVQQAVLGSFTHDERCAAGGLWGSIKDRTLFISTRKHEWTPRITHVALKHWTMLTTAIACDLVCIL